MHIQKKIVELVHPFCRG